MTTTIEDIAKICHEANRIYCESIFDYSQPEWWNAPEWQKNSIITGVKYRLDNSAATPAQMHESWLAVKTAEGWKYGAVKNVEAKEHPCFLPYDELPPAQQIKDHLFSAIVTALRGAL